MTDYAWPSSLCVQTAEWRMLANTAAFGDRTLARVGDRWSCTLTFPVLTRDQAVTLKVFLGRLRGRAHRAVLPVHGYVKRGHVTTNGFVLGAGQTGLTLTCDGVESLLTQAVRTGDWLGVNGRLYMVAADADTDTRGRMTVQLTHPLGVAPADNAVVSLLNPTARFVLAGDLGWQNMPPGLAQIEPVEFVEDIP